LHGDRFILMPAISNDIGQRSVQLVTGLSVFMTSTGNRSAFTAAAALDCGTVRGTVDTTMKPVELLFYGSATNLLTLGTPLSSTGVRKAARLATPAARVRANDLIGELREISGQVNRMMTQVERAIDRLAVHSG
jgi:hypothetical protein